MRYILGQQIKFQIKIQGDPLYIVSPKLIYTKYLKVGTDFGLILSEILDAKI